MSEAQYSDISNGMSIQIYDKNNTYVSSCHMVAYSVKDKIGRLTLKENILINFDETEFKILLTGLSTGEDYKYQTIHDVVFDQNQEFTEDNKITFTLDKVSDWSRIKGW